MAIPVKGFATNLTKRTEYPFRFVKFVEPVLSRVEGFVAKRPPARPAALH